MLGGWFRLRTLDLHSNAHGCYLLTKPIVAMKIIWQCPSSNVNTQNIFLEVRFDHLFQFKQVLIPADVVARALMIEICVTRSR